MRLDSLLMLFSRTRAYILGSGFSVPEAHQVHNVHFIRTQEQAKFRTTCSRTVLFLLLNFPKAVNFACSPNCRDNELWRYSASIHNAFEDNHLQTYQHQVHAPQ